MTATRFLAALAVAVALTTAAVADDKPAKKKPDGVKSYDESAKAFPAGEKVTRNVTQYVTQTVQKQIIVNNVVQLVTETVRVPVTTAQVVVVPERKWTLGAEGWHDKDGFNVDKLAADSPLASVTVKDGNKEIVKKVAVGDVITGIGGKPVTNELDLFLAVQAADEGKLTIDVTAADGKAYSGTVTATKAKK